MNTQCPECGADSENGEDCQMCHDAQGYMLMALRGEPITREQAESVVRAWLWWRCYDSDPRVPKTSTVHATLGQMCADTGLSVSRARDILMHMADVGKVTYEAKQGVGFVVVVKEA